MERDTLNNKEVLILTVDEFFEEMKKYYTTSGNENTVVKCFSTSGGYQFWTKHKTLDEIARLWWKHEPLINQRFTEEECMQTIHDSQDAKGLAGCSFRWLFHKLYENKEMPYQPRIIPTVNTEEYILEVKKTMLSDRMMGILMDPFSFIEGFTKDRRPYANPDNYRVFCMEITVDEFEKESNSFVAIPEKWNYNDGLEMCIGYNRFDKTDAFKKFIEKHTKYKFED